MLLKFNDNSYILHDYALIASSPETVADSFIR